MEIKKVIDVEMDQNCYVIFEQDSQECIVIDPGNSYEKMFLLLKHLNKTVSAILLTHCHYDHISGLLDLAELSEAVVIASRECKNNINQVHINVSNMFEEKIDIIQIDKIVEDDEELMVAGIKIRCIKTPGHTNCSVCYLIEDHLFSGDTLFLSTIGRWDLPTGHYRDLEKSIREKLYSLDDEIVVHPGHGGDTSIGYEKKYNMNIKQ